MHAEAIRRLVADEACAQARLVLAQRDGAAAARAIARLSELRPDHPDLPELRATQALVCGNARRAEQILRRAAPTRARARLLQCLLQLQTGQRAAAHLALSAWSRQSRCPPQARVLAAWLDWQAGNVQIARARLQRHRAEQDDAQSDRLQLLIGLTEHMPRTGRQCADRLTARLGLHAPTWRFCRSLEVGESPDAVISPDLVNALAEQLIGNLDLVRTLVVAQQCSPRPARIQLLRRALLRIVDRVDDATAVIEALAGLAELAGDANDARRWARRGLRQPPYSAPLALLLDRLGEQAHSTQGAPVAGVLHRLAREHPDWPDVQRALVLRLHADGRTHLARHHLKQWSGRAGDQPLVRRTEQELAA
ncbi:MAG: hypothetical protein GVY28_10325 [Alphaproteobacteria bacterium]|jgi:hypothetical protein|nr:hypothetical protein [Alphaproteobacteria bacterium]